MIQLSDTIVDKHVVIPEQITKLTDEELLLCFRDFQAMNNPTTMLRSHHLTTLARQMSVSQQSYVGPVEMLIAGGLVAMEVIKRISSGD